MTRCHFCGDANPGIHLWTRNGLGLCADCVTPLHTLLTIEEEAEHSGVDGYCSYCRQHPKEFEVLVQGDAETTICPRCIQDAVTWFIDNGWLNDEQLQSIPPLQSTLPLDKTVFQSAAMIDALNHIDPLWQTVLRHHWGLEDGQPVASNVLHTQYFPHLNTVEFRRQLRQQEAAVFKQLRANH